MRNRKTNRSNGACFVTAQISKAERGEATPKNIGQHDSSRSTLEPPTTRPPHPKKSSLLLLRLSDIGHYCPIAGHRNCQENDKIATLHFLFSDKGGDVYRNYLLVAYRNLMRYKIYSVINIAGLAVGLMSVVLIGLYARHEFSYDRDHPHVERIYRVLREYLQEGSSTTQEGLSGALVPVIRETLPEVEAVLRLATREVWVRVGDQTHRHAQMVTERPFFEFFNFPLIEGNKDDLFKPSSIFVTMSTAQKLFGSEDPLGRVLALENDWFSGDYVVRGILEDPPRTSTIRFDLLISDKSIPDVGAIWVWNEWVRSGWSPVHVYLRLRSDAQPVTVEEKLDAVLRSHVGSEVAGRSKYHLQPLAEKYLYSSRDYGLRTSSWSVPGERSGDIHHVQMSLMVAALILGIACVNFANLGTARSLYRAREIGMRKAIGASRSQLILQFLGEASLVSILALLAGLVLAWLTLPLFNRLAERDLSLNLLGDIWLLGGLGSLSILTGLAAGIYPAMFLSRIDPATVLKGSHSSLTEVGGLRQGLVVSQFAIAIVLLVSTLVVYRQMQYVHEKDLGFSRGQIVIVPIFWFAQNDPAYEPYGLPLKRRYQDVKRAFLEHPNVLRAGTSRFYLQDETGHADIRAEGHPEPRRMRVFSVDESFFNVYDIGFVAGGPFSPKYAASPKLEQPWEGSGEKFILNETAVRQLGWDPQTALGKSMRFDHYDQSPGVVVGVVEDFHIQTLHTPLEPVVFNKDHWNLKAVHLKIKREDIQKTMTHLASVWRRSLPSRPFTSEFLDEKLGTYYRTEQRQAFVFRTSAFVAIFIGCLGLLGLSAFSAARRTREIGIRKVLGASVTDIVSLLSREFIILTAIANLIAWPIAYWAMNRWLSDFAYRIDLSIGIFALSGALALIIVLLSVCTQTLKAARGNPVEALRNE